MQSSFFMTRGEGLGDRPRRLQLLSFADEDKRKEEHTGANTTLEVSVRTGASTPYRTWVRVGSKPGVGPDPSHFDLSWERRGWTSIGVWTNRYLPSFQYKNRMEGKKVEPNKTP